MERVSTEEFAADVDRYSAAAENRPLMLTKEGNDTLALLSVSEYARLRSLDTRRVLRPEDLPDYLVDALERAEAPDWTARFDHEIET